MRAHSNLNLTTLSPPFKKVYYLSIYWFPETGFHYIAQAVLKLTILPQPPKCWDYRWVTP
jgi:hypothetical protein